MPFAIAVLDHPLAAGVSLAVAIVAALHAAQSRRFVQAFTAGSFTLLTAIAYLSVRPSAVGLAWLALGLVLLHAEFLWPTFGIAGLLGIGSTAWGSWLLLAALAPVPRMAATLLGVALFLAAVARTMRLRTLP